MKEISVWIIYMVLGNMMLVTSLFSCCQNKNTSTYIRGNPLRILVIGDSNTEIGNITVPLKSLIDSVYDNFGTGFCTLNPASTGQMPENLSLDCDTNWTLFDMRNNFTPELPPYFSPNGLSISSGIPGSIVNIRFKGEGIDLYYLRTSESGSFSVAVDGKINHTISCNNKKSDIEKVSLKNLFPAKHLLSVKVLSGKVTLLGIDAKKKEVPDKMRFILHKWGNAWASTEEYRNIDRGIFISSLKKLNPNNIVILLGTNDHNLDHRDFKSVKNNLIEIVNRIKEALPGARILIVSTFACDGSDEQGLLRNYVSYSFPESARETKVSYWDMNAWFGPFSPEKLDDGVHANKIYGKAIAKEIYKQLIR